jgi:hypothetical protein
MDNNLALKIESIASMKVILSCGVISMKGERTRYTEDRQRMRSYLIALDLIEHRFLADSFFSECNTNSVGKLQSSPSLFAPTPNVKPMSSMSRTHIRRSRVIGSKSKVAPRSFPSSTRTITTTHHEYANTTREEMEIQMQTAIILDCRGVRMSIERADLTELPESCLLVLFPNGVVLSSPRQLLTADDQEDRDEDVYYVDVSQSFPPAQRAMSNPLFIFGLNLAVWVRLV